MKNKAKKLNKVTKTTAFTDGEDTKPLDLWEESRLDWVCAQRFNKIIWSKWPDSMRGLYEVLQKKGYVVRHNFPAAGFQTTVKKHLMDLYVAEEETINQLFYVSSRGIDDEKIRKQVMNEFRLAQKSRLIYTTYLSESDGGAVAFALFRKPGTETCLVYVMHQCRDQDPEEELGL